MVFIVFSENHPFGGRAASETEKVVKMAPKMVQKATPNPPKTDQDGGLKKEPVRGPKVDAKGSILGGPGGSFLGLFLVHFGGQILVVFRGRSWSAKRGRGNPWQTTWGAALGPEAPWGAPLDMIYRIISLNICGSNTPLGHKGPANSSLRSARPGARTSRRIN